MMRWRVFLQNRPRVVPKVERSSKTKDEAITPENYIEGRRSIHDIKCDHCGVLVGIVTNSNWELNRTFGLNLSSCEGLQRGTKLEAGSIDPHLFEAVQIHNADCGIIINIDSVHLHIGYNNSDNRTSHILLQDTLLDTIFNLLH